MKQTKLLLFLIILGLCNCIYMRAQSPWDGTAESWTQGQGTEQDPYRISDPKHLAFLAQEVWSGKDFAGIYFFQTQDLDFNAATLGKEKGNFRPIGIYDAGLLEATNEPYDYSKRFQGVYNGGNHQISNLYQMFNNEQEEIIGGGGLFGAIGPEGIVKNLRLAASCLFESEGTSGSFACCLEGKLLNCTSAATVSGPNGEGRYFLAGLVSLLHSGDIDHCAFVGKVIGASNAAGIASDVYTASTQKEPSVTNSYVNATIECPNGFFLSGAAFGLIGTRITIQNFYATADMSQGLDGFAYGAFAGGFDDVKSKDTYPISNCFYDQERINLEEPSGDGPIKGVTPLTTAELKNASTLQALGDAFAADTDNQNGGYPVLKPRDPEAPTFIDLPKEQPQKLYTEGKQVHIVGSLSSPVKVFDLSGQLIKETYQTSFELPEGTYVVQLSPSVATKIVLR